MAEDTETTVEDQEYVAPKPAENPRNQALAEIAASVARQHAVEFAETAPSVDDEGNITPASEPEAALATEETPISEPEVKELAPAATIEASTPKLFDPAKEYEVTIDGQKVMVAGQKLIEAGFRTFQKEAAADYRLELASKLLREAEQRSVTPPTLIVPTAPSGPSDAELADALQYGTPEQAAKALSTIRERMAVDPKQLSSLVATQARQAAEDAVLFNQASTFAQQEYSDIFSNDYLKRLWLSEEKRRRTPKDQGGEGDNSPYMEFYKSLGEDLRKGLNLQKPSASAPTSAAAPTGSVSARAAAKANVPPVPRTASSRLAATDASAKVKTPSEVIAAMSAARGMNRLSQPRKE